VHRQRRRARRSRSRRSPSCPVSGERQVTARCNPPCLRDFVAVGTSWNGIFSPRVVCVVVRVGAGVRSCCGRRSVVSLALRARAAALRRVRPRRRRRCARELRARSTHARGPDHPPLGGSGTVGRRQTAETVRRRLMTWHGPTGCPAFSAGDAPRRRAPRRACPLQRRRRGAQQPPRAAGALVACVVRHSVGRGPLERRGAAACSGRPVAPSCRSAHGRADVAAAGSPGLFCVRGVESEPRVL
jgi:hypothetical protein